MEIATAIGSNHLLPGSFLVQLSGVFGHHGSAILCQRGHRTGMRDMTGMPFVSARIVATV
ncbi:MAG: hypothetical protein AAB262_03410 [Elusimicrobiota bacterium]